MGRFTYKTGLCHPPLFLLTGSSDTVNIVKQCTNWGNLKSCQHIVLFDRFPSICKIIFTHGPDQNWMINDNLRIFKGK